MITSALIVPCLSVFSLASTEMPATSALAEPVQADIAEVQQKEQSSEVILQPVEEEAAADEGPLPLIPEAVEVPEADLPIVFEDLSDEEVFVKAAEHIQSIGTMKADFIQIAPSGNISTGQLKLSRPGRLRFDYDEPVPTLIVATQGLVYVHDKDLETTDSYPVGKTPLKFLLSRKVKTEDAVLTDVFRGQDEVTLTLQSSDEDTQGELALVFAAPELQLKRWAVVDPNGGVTVVELENVSLGEKISNRDFRIPEAGSSFTRDR